MQLRPKTDDTQEVDEVNVECKEATYLFQFHGNRCRTHEA